MKLLLGAAPLCLLLGCSTHPSPPAPTGASPAAPPQARAPAAPSAAVAPLLLLLPEAELDAGRDPFQRPDRLKPPPRPPLQGKVALSRYSLDELKLVGLIRGAKDRALFVAPGGEGATVRRGDRLGKDGTRVRWILPAGVVMRVEAAGESQSYEADRLIRIEPRRLGPS